MTIPINVDLLAAVVHLRGVRLGGVWFGAPELGHHLGDRVHAVLSPSEPGMVGLFDAETGRFVCWAFRVPTRRSEVCHA